MRNDIKIFDKATPLPAAFFAAPLGLGAMAIAWHRAEAVFVFAHELSVFLGMMAFFIWLFLFVLYVYKAISCRKHLLDELYCPVRFALITLIFISAMVMGELWVLWGFREVGSVLVISMIVLQLGYGTWRIGSLWRGEEFKQNSTLPPFYLPAVASNFTSASALALLGYENLSPLFFGAGFFAWLMFEPVLLQHLRTQSVDAKLRSTLGIIIAPAFVGVSSYVSMTGEIDMFAKMMFGYGVLQLLFVFRLLPWIAQGGVGANFWSFSFGLASMANVSMLFYQDMSLHVMGMTSFVFSNLCLFLLMAISCLRLIQGRYFGIK